MNARRTLITAAATFAGLLSAVATPAAERAMPASLEIASVVVQYGDLDLDTDRGIRQLQRRLVNAANEVCGRPDPRNLRLAEAARECVDAAIARAVAEVGNARLAQINAGRGRSLRG